VNLPTPAIVTQLAARRLPRRVLLLLVLAYVLPGLLGRDPWRNADLAAFGVMLDMAHGGPWLHPQLLGQPAEVVAWLPYWLGAVAIKALPFLPADLAVRIPFGALLMMALTCTWYAMYHLARLPAAQPVSFAFGGEARPVDYARALSDAALLALVASLGLALLSHESTPDTAQLAFAALLLYACARLASDHARWRWFSALVWWLGTVGLALSGAPWLGLALGGGWLAWTAMDSRMRTDRQDWWVWAFCATGTLVAALLAWELELPRRVEAWSALDNWLHTDAWRRYGQLLLWFTWPAGPLALWTVWGWRRRLSSPHILLPLWFAAVGMVSSWLLGASDRALLMALPGLACLAALALPTLSRSVTALIDWFALLFFTGCAVIIWVIWVAMQTGVPAKPAANVQRLVPNFEASFSWALWLPALAATLIWIGLLAWRVGRHRPALWKSLVLSAAGSTLCWLLLMTLWLPLLNHGMGLEPVSKRIASLVPHNSCVLVHGLSRAQETALMFHGQLKLNRPGRNGATSCQALVVEPGAYKTLNRAVDLSGWTLLTQVPRLRENRDHLLLFLRKAPEAGDGS
jgi:4-amino-4-deoxy-L-arabinose transferase-like glycosyltransferase